MDKHDNPDLRIHNSLIVFPHPFSLLPFMNLSFLTIRPSGHGVQGVFPAMVPLPAWPVWPAQCWMLPPPACCRLHRVANGSGECARPGRSNRRLKGSSHVPPNGSGRTCWRIWPNKTLLITDSALVDTHSHFI